MVELVTEAELSRARVDPEFRQELMAHNLEALLEALNRVHRGEDLGPDAAKLMREGTTLALQLADQLQKALGEPGPHLIDAVLTRR